jgi:uncharacterized protein
VYTRWNSCVTGDHSMAATPRPGSTFGFTSMQEAIKARLSEIERTSGIRPLIVVESGSRAWGFPSPDSDYDVRIIFARPVDGYLTVTERSDTLDFPIVDELDVTGWDVRKTLALAARSNATPMEWLQSPIVYHEEAEVRAQLWQAVSDFFCPRSVAAHYLGLTKRSLRRLREQGAEQKLKTWFYVFRPLFAAEWILSKQSIPPMEFAPLREMTNDMELAEMIDDLLVLKKRVSESFTMETPAALWGTIENRLTTCQGRLDSLQPRKRDAAEMDEVFRRIVRARDEH